MFSSLTMTSRCRQPLPTPASILHALVTPQLVLSSEDNPPDDMFASRNILVNYHIPPQSAVNKVLRFVLSWWKHVPPPWGKSGGKWNSEPFVRSRQCGLTSWFHYTPPLSPSPTRTTMVPPDTCMWRAWYNIIHNHNTLG